MKTLSLLTVLIFSLHLPLMAQDNDNGPDANAVGFPTNGLFSGSEIENVQINNGSLHVHIPLYSAPGRNGVGSAGAMIYDSESFTPNQECGQTCNIYIQPAVGLNMIPPDASVGRIGAEYLDNSILHLATAGTYSIPFHVAVRQTCEDWTHWVTTSGIAPSDWDGTKHQMVPSVLTNGGGGSGHSQDCWPTTSATLYASDGSGWSGVAASNYFVSKTGGVPMQSDTNGNVSGSLDTGASTPFTYFDSNGVSHTITVVNENVTIATNLCASVAGITPCFEYYDTWPMPHIITLADGLTYTIEYLQNQEGEISSITLPTGAVISYTYLTGATPYLNGRPVHTRTLTVNGVSSTWTYDFTQSNGSTPATMRVTDPPVAPASAGAYVVHTFGAFSTNPYLDNDIPLVPSFLVTKEQHYEGSGALLKTVDTTYGINSLPITETTTWPTGQVSKIETDYETMVVPMWPLEGAGPQTAPITWGNVREKREYGFGNGAAGSLLRRTDYTYLHTDVPGASGAVNPNANQAAYLAANIADRPTSETVYDGSSHKVAQTLYYYDEGTLISTSANPAWDRAYPITGTIRGNLTTVKKWVHVPNGTAADSWATTTYTYDDLGNRRSELQPDGQGMSNPGAYLTTYDYTDNYVGPSCRKHTGQTYVFPTTITQVDLNGQTHRIRKSYYQCSGLVAGVQDENDIVAGRAGTVHTYDSMNRIHSITYPDTGSTTVSISNNGTNDTIPLVVTTTRAMNATQNEVTVTTLDGLGRTVKTQTAAATVETGYDPLGHVYSVSNPYVTTVDSTYGITYHYYDGLGRPTSTVNPDGTSPTSSYADTLTGSTDLVTTSNDEAGVKWERASDGLGRLTKVVEKGTVANPLNLLTSYSYDTLGNLGSVTQNGTTGETPRNRYFTYDSLSRLVASQNPETGTICYGTVPSGQTPLPVNQNPPAPNCTPGYDRNGNLLYKTDAVGMTINYAYDDLNRIRAKSAPDSYTAAAFYYDQGTNGIGRMWAEATPGGLEGTIFSYDVMGRVTGTQWFNYATQNWQTGMGVLYDLAGNVTQLTYPDGRQVNQTWDVAGRVSSVADGPLGGTGAPYVSSIQYAPSGAVTGATFRNGVTQTFALNKRFQPCHSMATTAAIAANANGGNLLDRASFYSVNPTSTCGNESGDNGNIYAIADNLQTGLTQSFSYDSLNRLRTASRSDGVYNHTYNIDSFGNMLLVDNLHTPLNYGTDQLTNRLTLNATDLQYYDNGELKSAPNPAGGSHSFTYTADGYIRCIDSCNTGNYLYNALGERTRAVHNNAAWNEYVYLNSQPMADIDDTGKWSDYIYANGQKIAKVDSQKSILHNHGYRDGNNWACGQEGPVNGIPSGVAGLVIASGDRMTMDMKQNIATLGGLALIFTNSTGTGALNDIATGQPFYFNASSDGQWHHFVGDLSPYANMTVSYVLGGFQHNGAYGTYDMWITNAAIVHANGSVVPLITGQNAFVPNLTGTGCGGQQMTSATELTPTTDPAVSANYYVDDHLGTMQMELSSGGWPIWEGQFTPFGQEIVAGATNNTIGQQPPDGTSMRFKFTGKERDTESGLDYFGARYYASNMGRWMSPDWADKPEAVPYSSLDDPQTLNLYEYVRNNPLGIDDPDGHGWWSDFGNGLANSTYRPLVQAVAHPINTAVGLGHAAAHPINTAIAAKNAVVATGKAALSGNGAAIGAAVGTIGMALVPGVGELGDGAEAAEGLARAGQLADEANVVRGGLPGNIANGTGVSVGADGTLSGVSVNSANGASVSDLSAGIPHNQVSTTTVGEVRAAGGNVVPSPTANNPNHCTMCGVTPQQAKDIMKTIPNPRKNP